MKISGGVGLEAVSPQDVNVIEVHVMQDEIVMQLLIRTIFFLFFPFRLILAGSRPRERG